MGKREFGLDICRDREMKKFNGNFIPYYNCCGTAESYARISVWSEEWSWVVVAG